MLKSMSRHVGGARRLAALSASVLLIGTLLAAPASADSGKLSFFSWDNEQTMKPVIDAFEKENPSIKIDFSTAPPVNEYELCTHNPPKMASSSSEL